MCMKTMGRLNIMKTRCRATLSHDRSECESEQLRTKASYLVDKCQQCHKIAIACDLYPSAVSTLALHKTGRCLLEPAPVMENTTLTRRISASVIVWPQLWDVLFIFLARLHLFPSYSLFLDLIFLLCHITWIVVRLLWINLYLQITFSSVGPTRNF